MKVRLFAMLMPGLLALTLGPGPQAQDTPPPGVRYDSSAVVVRTPAADVLAPYRNDAAYLYDREPTAPLGLWERLSRWLDETLFKPLRDVTPRWAEQWFFYLLAAAGIAFALFRLLRMDVAGAFYRKRKPPPLAFETILSNIQGVDFDQLIEEAVAARDYRRAIRLLYLKTLKTLAGQTLIDWQRDKTNHEYISELRAPVLRPAFAELTRLFEYVWYGDFAVDESAFGRLRHAFARFDQQIETAHEVATP